MIRFAPVLSLTASLVLASTAFGLEHFTVYHTIGSAPPAELQPVTVADQFGVTTTTLGIPRFHLAPADKNNEGRNDPSHLTCYEVDDPISPPPTVFSSNQFGVQTLNLAAVPSYLCTPAEFLAPGGIDHYQCYDATGPALLIGGVSLDDQFQTTQVVTVLDPFLFCTPADKNGEGIQNPIDHLTCFDTIPHGQPFGSLNVVDQFFPGGHIIDDFLQAPHGLCVPSLKSLPVPDRLDHFSVYDTLGLSGPPVQLQDQFGVQVTDLGNLNLFLVPADKNGEGISDPISHLGCYEILDGEPAPSLVWADNQLGEQLLNLGDPRELCVPTEKLSSPGAVDIDHYKCYEAFGDPLDVPIDWVDQFQGVSVDLVDPFLFCNPAEKNGEPIQNSNDHLACFTTQPTPLSANITIENQFHFAEEDVVLNETIAFCLPSAKRLAVPFAAPSFSPTGIALLALGMIGTALLLLRRGRSKSGGA